MLLGIILFATLCYSHNSDHRRRKFHYHKNYNKKTKMKISHADIEPDIRQNDYYDDSFDSMQIFVFVFIGIISMIVFISFIWSCYKNCCKNNKAVPNNIGKTPLINQNIDSYNNAIPPTFPLPNQDQLIYQQYCQQPYLQPYQQPYPQPYQQPYQYYYQQPANIVYVPQYTQNPPLYNQEILNNIK